MHLLFLISGISAAFSLKKRDGGQLMLERINRLLTPLLIGIIFVVSIQTWLGALSFGTFTDGYFSFFPVFINIFRPNNSFFNWGQLWFLAYLFVISAIALPLFLSIKNKGETSRIISNARHFSHMPLFLLPALWIGFLEGLFRPGWPGALNLVNDWAVFTISFSFFLAGYLMGKVPELLEAATKYRLAALILGLLAFIVRMSIYKYFLVPDGYNLANIAAQVCRGLAAYGLVMAAVGYGQRYLTWQGKPLGIAKDLSFPLYILHYAPLTAATYLLLNSGLSLWLRWILAVFASWLFVALFTFIARYIPVVRDFFGIRKPATKSGSK